MTWMPGLTVTRSGVETVARYWSCPPARHPPRSATETSAGRIVRRMRTSGLLVCMDHAVSVRTEHRSQAEHHDKGDRCAHRDLSLIHISEPTRLLSISYA